MERSLSMVLYYTGTIPYSDTEARKWAANVLFASSPPYTCQAFALLLPSTQTLARVTFTVILRPRNVDGYEMEYLFAQDYFG
jgi:hypothetical protein